MMTQPDKLTLVAGYVYKGRVLHTRKVGDQWVREWSKGVRDVTRQHHVTRDGVRTVCGLEVAPFGDLNRVVSINTVGCVRCAGVL